MKKSFITMLIAITLTAVMLAGCGSSNDGGSPGIDNDSFSQQTVSPRSGDNSDNQETSGDTRQPSESGFPTELENNPDSSAPPQLPLTFTLAEITPEYTVSDVWYGGEGLLRARYTQGIRAHSTHVPSFGYLDENGKVVHEPIYNSFGNREPIFSEGKAILRDVSQNRAVLLTSSGEVKMVFLSDYYGYEINYPSVYSNSRAIDSFGYNGDYRVYDENGGLVFELLLESVGFGTVSYSELGRFNCDRAVVGKSDSALGGTYLLIMDNNGNLIKEIHYNDRVNGYSRSNGSRYEYSDNLLSVRERADGLWGVLDIHGNIVLDFIYEELGQPNEGLIPFMRYGTWGYIDYQGNEVIERQFESAGKFNDGLAVVIVGTTSRYETSTFGVINSSGDLVFSGDYHRFDEFNEYGFAYAQTINSNLDRRGYLIDKEGNTLLEVPRNYNYLGGKFFEHRQNNSHSGIYKIAELP